MAGDRSTDVDAWLAERTDEMAELLETLVRVPTENPPGRELGRCAAVLSDALDRLGFAPELIELSSPGGLEAPAIVRGTVGDGSEFVYYHGPDEYIEEAAMRRCAAVYALLAGQVRR